jgi:uncharacterized RDD family membrane protein YckC
VIVVGALWLPALWLVDQVFHSDGVAFAALIVIALAYGSLMESSRFQGTLGFKMFSLRVMREDGRTLNLLQAFIRSLLRLLLSGALVTWLVPAVNARKRALWDYPAGAYVVGPKRAGGRDVEIANTALSQEVD